MALMQKALLLDLGNVVLGIDFRRVFSYWAEAADVEEQVFYDGWAMDHAYREHEIGAISFSEYTEALSKRFRITLPEDEWLTGWNSLWTDPFHRVIELLPQLAERYQLYGFSNTNDAHARDWRSRYRTELAPFETIFASSEIGMRKPDAQAFGYVCEAIGTSPQHTIFLDDTLENVRGARASGLEARHVPTEEEVVATLRALLE